MSNISLPTDGANSQGKYKYNVGKNCGYHLTFVLWSIGHVCCGYVIVMLKRLLVNYGLFDVGHFNMVFKTISRFE